MNPSKRKSNADRYFKCFGIFLGVFIIVAFFLGSFYPNGNTDGMDPDVSFLLGAFLGVLVLSIVVFGSLAIVSFFRERTEKK